MGYVHESSPTHPPTASCRLLSLDECRGLSAGDLMIALTGLRQLRSLELNGIPEVTDTLLMEAALACPLTEVSTGIWVHACQGFVEHYQL